MMGLLVLTVLAMAFGPAVANYGMYEYNCPAENGEVDRFRKLIDVRTPLSLPRIETLVREASYSPEEIQHALINVDLPWKVSLEYNRTLAIPFHSRCCNKQRRWGCESVQMPLQYLKHYAGVCWVVHPEEVYFYTRCTCCSCLMTEGCPVVGRCVEANYQTVMTIAYCPHMMYSERFQKIALRLPTSCRCQAGCPTDQEHPRSLTPEESKERASRLIAEPRIRNVDPESIRLAPAKTTY